MVNQHFPPGTGVVAYLRDSGGKRQDLSVPQQEERVRAWCSECGYILTRVFKDVARSAKSVVGREEFHALIHYFDQDGVTERGVVLWDLSRWARELKSGLKYFLDLSVKNVDIIPIAEEIPSGPYGLFVIVAKFMSAEDENRRRAVNVKRGLVNLARNYKCYPLPFVPTGYKREIVEIGTRRDGVPHMASRLVIDPITAPLVLKAFEMAAGGASLSEIMHATKLYGDVSGVNRMLEKPIYLGTFNYCGVTIPDFCQPIIDEELFNKVQQVRARMSAWRGRNAGQPEPAPYDQIRRRESPYMLAGLIYCANCGHPMHCQRYHAWHYYICSRLPSRRISGTCNALGVRSDLVENDVLKRLREILSSPDVLKDTFLAQKQGPDPFEEFQEQIDRQKLEIKDLQGQIIRITDALAKRPSSDALLAKLDQLEAMLRDSRQKLAEIEANRPAKPIGLDDLENMRQTLLTRLDESDERTRQLLLRALRTKVIVRRKTGIRNTTLYVGKVEFDLGVQVEFPVGLEDEQL